MDTIQKALIKVGRKDLAQEYYLKIKKAVLKIDSMDMGTVEEAEKALTFEIKVIRSQGFANTYEGNIDFEMSNGDKINFAYHLKQNPADKGHFPPGYEKEIIEISGNNGTKRYDTLHVDGFWTDKLRDCYSKYLMGR